MILKIPPHPAAELLPPVEGEAYALLREDVRKNGLLEPGVTHQGKLLEGCTRQRICHELGLPFPTVEWQGECGTPEEFVFSKNVARRHLNKSQQALLAVMVKLPTLEEAARARMVQGGKRSRKKARPEQEGVAPGPPPGGNARDEAARLFDVGARSITRAKTLLQSGRTDLIEQVRLGKLLLVPALRILRGEPTPTGSSHSQAPAPTTVLQEAAPPSASETRAPETASASPQEEIRLAPVEDLGFIAEEVLVKAVRAVMGVLTGPLFNPRDSLDQEVRARIEKLVPVIDEAHMWATQLEWLGRGRARARLAHARRDARKEEAA